MTNHDYDYSLYSALYQADKGISRNSKLIVGMLFALVVLLVGIASNMAFNDEANSLDTYCEMVDIGAWPDFKETFERDCGGKPPKRVTKKLL